MDFSININNNVLKVFEYEADDFLYDDNFYINNYNIDIKIQYKNIDIMNNYICEISIFNKDQTIYKNILDIKNNDLISVLYYEFLHILNILNIKYNTFNIYYILYN